MQIIKKSIAAGVFIALAATIYLNCTSKIVGAFLFAIGLIMVFTYRAKLFTGYVGSMRTPKELLIALIILVGNFIGCFAVLLFSSVAATEIWSAKLAVPHWLVFGKAIMCGALIEFCVEQNKKQNPILTFMSCLIAIPAFILGGAEHSIADICYMISCGAWSLDGLVFIVIAVVGNVVGAQLLNRLKI